MAAPQNFRAALNGFNREDVVHYIEYLNARHETQINQLNAELDLLRSRTASAGEISELSRQLELSRKACEQLQSQLVQREDTILALEQQLANGPGPDTALVARCAQLEAELAQCDASRRSLEAELAAARTAAVQNQVGLELEAYRRAERTERVARERAEQVYRQANGALADATVKVDEAFSQLSGLADQVGGQLAQLQQAVASSRQALADATGTLYAIRPGAEEN